MHSDFIARATYLHLHEINLALILQKGKFFMAGKSSLKSTG